MENKVTVRVQMYERDWIIKGEYYPEEKATKYEPGEDSGINDYEIYICDKEDYNEMVEVTDFLKPEIEDALMDQAVAEYEREEL